MRIISAIKKIRRRLSIYQPCVEILIHRQAILRNLKTFQDHVPTWQIAPVLKSNAYGHGIVEVAKIVDHEDIAFIVVDSPYEAIILRQEGIRVKILVIGYTLTKNICGLNLQNVTYTISTISQLKELAARLKKKQKIHIKVDTGMHRQGILLPEIEETLKILKDANNLELEGVCSHLADAVNNVEFTKQQIANWHIALSKFALEYPNLAYKHLSATSAFGYGGSIQANVARVGLGLYGISDYKAVEHALEPALEMKTIISGIKTVRAEGQVGYALTYKAARDVKAALIPVGYFEGVDLRLSNKGYIKVKDRFCPILGRVSMNITTLDVSQIHDLGRDDTVTVISREVTDPNSVKQIAKICGTIPYEILAHIPQHLRRTVV